MTHLSISELSEITGKDRRTVSRALANVKPEVNPSNPRAKLFDSRMALQLLFASGSADGNGEVRDLDVERARLASAQANRAELDVAERRGELLKASDVTHEVTDAFRRVRARLLSLSTKIAPLVVGSTDAAEIKATIDLAVEDALNELVAAERPDAETVD